MKNRKYFVNYKKIFKIFFFLENKNLILNNNIFNQYFKFKNLFKLKLLIIK